MPSRSWGSSSFPKVRDHAASSEPTSDSDLELYPKRPKFLSQSFRSRSSSPSGSPPRTPGSCDSSPRASPSGESHWGFSSPKVLNLSKSFGRRLGFSRSAGSGGNRPPVSVVEIRPRRQPMLLKKLPSEEEDREDYMTVAVGERSGKREKFIINKHLLTHHLLQTLFKCSEDMVEPHDNGSEVLIFCDPALFLHLVQAISADLGAELS